MRRKYVSNIARERGTRFLSTVNSLYVSFIEYNGVFYRLLHPRPTILLITLCPGDRVNIMPASWNLPISEEPPTIGVAVYRETFTYQCLNYHPEATINVPSIKHVDLIYQLGSVSGRDVDKIREFKVQLIPSDIVKAPTWRDAIAAYEVRVMNRLDVGESTLFVFEVLKVKVKTGIADEWSIDFSKTNIPLHGAGRVFHRVDPRKVFAKKSLK
ncbi:flavin reductase domain protein, FMN-binding protein [Vulcanisaeta moutnovskia 768-28]|uniref:Flavin reductase domain protein, FMN-binding protein n=1 Tax=Vulcanisaeta moutnovskia (strain 768-28) TaxID=985053 RepID=F0QSH7_VULM7|nr:flavin reductase family protein [Vulcanisaeta moutnovskia]ADY00328.1 flavin reductase domain protein, FMN-binding protein [Vulcanisaeta moutnovskia 768-28]